ncbi:glycosyltransferase family 4 protein [Priestia flexa]|uniref:glycosyltransferase family 4 protein n=1 Tax=Priestia flexa TaxID=86664 RepID=UPI000C23C27F|nr:glycosyltransferase family 4 protein [Priestia flexa]MEC0666411.1 glycosyltransferase family 4 protein [Priestia flexa]WHX80028.1 glycosyltransferase family 4 protein [Priestia flexa]
MKKIYIIGQLPPPIHGLSKAIETLANSEMIKKTYNIESLNITNNKKILNHIMKIIKSKADVYYFTISQTKFGNLRDMLILLVLLMKKQKIIIHYHGGYYKKLYLSMSYLQKKVNRILISKIDIMIALGNSLKLIFEDVINIDKVRVCENFVEDASLIQNQEFDIKQIQMVKQLDLNVLYLSNFIETKGYKDVLKAAMLIKGEKNITFNFAGAFYSKQAEKEFKYLIDEYGISSLVKYHGVVSGEKKRNLLRDCSIFVLPTYYPNEGQPISIIEAMGNGLAVISTSHAGIPDIVDKTNGFIVKKQSPDQIANHIINLYRNREFLVDITRKNRALVMSSYKEINYIKKLDKIFNEVINK